MQVIIKHHDWRVLREVLRAKGRPVLGSKLRLEMSRVTKGCRHLPALVHHGLLAVASPDDEPAAATYVLTDLGKVAADYGVYEQDWETVKALAVAESKGKPHVVGRKPKGRQR